jgi:hypothetical protein
MTASVGRKVQANPLSAVALEGALAQTEHAGGEDLGDLGEAVGGAEGSRDMMAAEKRRRA